MKSRDSPWPHGLLVFVIKNHTIITIKEFNVGQSVTKSASPTFVSIVRGGRVTINILQSTWISNHLSMRICHHLSSILGGLTINISQSAWIGDCLSSILRGGGWELCSPTISMQSTGVENYFLLKAHRSPLPFVRKCLHW